ncbi:ATP-binding protein [Luteimonas sp. MJ174]|uniref:PAS domain-containing sensor histidine kinase n=1 Tax=Luteimonas sp. MJ174 TaxID=3129237 RepID=UPI0031B9B3AA
MQPVHTSLPGHLADETRQLALLLNSVTDYAIYMLDACGIVRSWNPGGVRIKGYSAEEVIGSHFSRFYTPDEVRDGVPQRNLKTAETEGRFSAEGWRVRRDGTQFLASVVIDPIWAEDGALLGFAKITRDITERHEADRRLQQTQQALFQAQKMEAIGLLTLGLAHDFNNLLTVVVNSLDIIGHRSTDERTAKVLETAMRAADRGVLLTRQLLSFGRGQVLAAESEDVNALVRESEPLLRRAAADLVDLSLALVPGPALAEIDRGQFEAALLNLVINSRDAMPQGGRVTVSTAMRRTRLPGAPHDDARLFIRASVTDNGPGIPLEHQSRVFEPFFTTKEVGRGSGLGLSQVFGFAAQSGGFAELHSTPGHGTSVSIHLPAFEAS